MVAQEGQGHQDGAHGAVKEIPNQIAKIRGVVELFGVSGARVEFLQHVRVRFAHFGCEQDVRKRSGKDPLNGPSIEIQTFADLFSAPGVMLQVVSDRRGIADDDAGAVLGELLRLLDVRARETQIRIERIFMRLRRLDDGAALPLPNNLVVHLSLVQAADEYARLNNFAVYR